MSDLGPRAINLVRWPVPEPKPAPNGGLIAHVMHIDHFGNLILDAKARHLKGAASFELAGRTIDYLSRTFADVPPGELVAYIGSSQDHVEIAVRDGSAAGVLGLDVGDQVLVRTF
jgi:S-adenosylmethionine hydrolase